MHSASVFAINLEATGRSPNKPGLFIEKNSKWHLIRKELSGSDRGRTGDRHLLLLVYITQLYCFAEQPSLATYSGVAMQRQLTSFFSYTESPVTATNRRNELTRGAAGLEQAFFFKFSEVYFIWAISKKGICENSG